MDTASISSDTAVTAASGKSGMALTGDDFLKIMITELTNQDPMEPMNNQDLLNQMATIQQLQSSQDMTDSFENLMDRYDSLLVRQELSTASQMIGQLVSGNTTAGQAAMGKVVAVNLDGENVLLELDTGQQINIDKMTQLGGSTSQDLVGQTIIGMTQAGTRVVGQVESVEVNGSEVLLHLHLPGTDEDETVAVPLTSASVIDQNTVDLLIGYTAKGVGGVSGVVESVEWTSEGVLLNIVNSDDEHTQLPLDELTGLY